tara:strand:+ start:76 stop:276 length:201 start_codon:yes stop_codon:yes gene_type:complete
MLYKKGHGKDLSFLFINECDGLWCSVSMTKNKKGPKRSKRTKKGPKRTKKGHFHENNINIFFPFII